LRPDDILDKSVVDVIGKELEQTFVMTNEVPFRQFSFRHVYGDAQDLNRRAMLVTLNDNFAATYPPPSTITVPDSTLVVGNFVFHKFRIVCVAMSTEVARMCVALEETKALADKFLRLIP
jgi:hypothetical protein